MSPVPSTSPQTTQPRRSKYGPTTPLPRAALPSHLNDCSVAESAGRYSSDRQGDFRPSGTRDRDGIIFVIVLFSVTIDFAQTSRDRIES